LIIVPVVILSTEFNTNIKILLIFTKLNINKNKIIINKLQFCKLSVGKYIKIKDIRR